MLSEQDTRAVEAMARCNIELDELCTLFPIFEKEDISVVMKSIAEEKIRDYVDMHSVNINCS